MQEVVPLATVQTPRFTLNFGSRNNAYHGFVRVTIGLIILCLFFWMFLFSQISHVAHAPAYYYILGEINKTKNSTYSSILNITKQKAVILAGPHKTGSSSIQSNLYSWSQTGSLGNDWTWVTPNMTCVLEHSSTCGNPAWLSLPTHVYKAWNCAGICLLNETLNKISKLCSKLMTCYSGALGEAVFAKKNMVFGYEGFTFDVVRLQEEGEEHQLNYIQKLVDTLPSTFVTKDDITVVITYRAPRIDQVTSSWKHQRDIQKAYHGTRLTFRSFLSSKLFVIFHFDSLGAAKVIAEKFGLNVVILDTSGIQLMGYDISNVVACQILGSPCNLNNMSLALGGNSSTPRKENVREDDKNLNDLTLEEKLTIESILQKLDCNSAHFIFRHSRIQVIYPHLVNQTVHSCSINHTYYTHEQALQDIRSAVAR